MTCRSHILHAFAVAAMLAGAAFAQEEGERKMSAAERLRRLPKLATSCSISRSSTLRSLRSSMNRTTILS